MVVYFHYLSESSIKGLLILYFALIIVYPYYNVHIFVYKKCVVRNRGGTVPHSSILRFPVFGFYLYSFKPTYIR